MSNPKQLELHFQYGISSEQACILCHLSASCSGCCLKFEKKEGCQGQVCSQPFKDHEGQRWDTWMHIVTTQLTHLLKYIPKELRKKYGIKPKCPAHHAQGDKHPFVWDWKHLVIISPDKLTYDKIRTITASLHKT